MNSQEDVRMHGASNRFLLHFGNEQVETLLQRLENADGLLIVHQTGNGERLNKLDDEI